MLVLLPPSETKRVGGDGRLDPLALRHAAVLGAARARVRKALVQLSSGDEDAAAKALKLGVKNRGELAHNLELEESGVLPAIERYTGVLYDALDVETLDAPARDWLNANVAVQSALFGLVGAGDPIPAYRLSGGSRLASLEQPLKRVWEAAHAELDWDGAGLVLDLRSKDYQALAPIPQGKSYLLNVVQRGEDGEVRALNHFNKAAKGDLVRRLALTKPNLTTPKSLTDWAHSQGLEVLAGPGEGVLTLVTELGAPGAASAASGSAR